MFGILFTKNHPDAVIPLRATPNDAGADLYSIEEVILPPRTRRLVSTGLSIAIPNGFVGLIHPRSGLALKKGITVLNAPGTIDSGYRGDIGVILYNASDLDVTLEKGERIAQLVIQEVILADFELVNELPNSERGGGGFGSTGSK